MIKQFKASNLLVLQDIISDFKTIELNADDAFLFGTGLWHRSSFIIIFSRWSCFRFYGPWYFKPYYNYPLMSSNEDVNHFDEIILDSLYFTLNQPLYQISRSMTLLTPDEFRKEHFYETEL